MYEITVTCKLFWQSGARSSMGFTFRNWHTDMSSELNEKYAPDWSTFHMSAHIDTERDIVAVTQERP